jgi:hypothetical protein
MAGRELPAAGLLLALVVGGCSASPQPVARAEALPEAAAPAPEASSAASSPAPPADASAREDKPVVVDPGEEEEGGPVSLVEAARAEKERRARAGQPIAVITDKTLPHYASKGQITVADGNQRQEPAAPAQPPGGEPAVRDEHYWRSRALEIRLRWRQAADEVGELEQRSAELRQQFYREDDPFLRDNRIKPDWDRVLDRLRQARLEVDAARKELAAFLEEGRRAEALPGWLREGESEEPKDEPVEQTPQPAQSIEPPVLAEPAGEPPRERG